MKKPNKVIIVVLAILVILVGGFYIFQSSTKTSGNSEDNQQVGSIQGSIIAKGYGVYRTLQNSTGAGNVIEVNLEVFVGDANYYIIDERIPEGWVVSDAAGGSTKDPGHIKWVEFSNAKDTIITYKLIAPTNQKTYSFSGNFVLGDSEEKTIIGNNEIRVG